MHQLIKRLCTSILYCTYVFKCKLKLQVLTVDVKARRVILTQQAALVDSQLPPVTCLKQLSKGQLVHGFVAAVALRGIVLRFYNNVRGLIERSAVRPSSEGGTGTPTAGEPALGQVLIARVLQVNPKRKMLRLSLNLNVCAAFPSAPEYTSFGTIITVLINTYCAIYFIWSY